MQLVQNKMHTHDSYIIVTFNNYIYVYVLGHKEFACKAIYDISINGLVIYITRIQENP